MKNFKFYNPTKIFFGSDKLNVLGSEILKYGKKVLLVTGQGSVKRIGLYKKVVKILEKNDIKIYNLEGVEPNPRIDLVRKGTKIAKEKKIDIVLAVGGGSTIDTAKTVAAAVKYDGDPWEMFDKNNDPVAALPIATVLTLAATGSEMNNGAVISNKIENRKLSIHSDVLFPKFSVLDPTITFSVPQKHTIYGIIDITAHVLEQYFTHVKEVPLQDRWAEGIILTLMEESKKVLKNPKDYDSRANILLCSTMALNGLLAMGVEDERTTHPCHKLEHELSAYYDIPHGAGLSILLPNWLDYVMKNDISKFVQFGNRIFGLDVNKLGEKYTATEGIKLLRKWFKEIGAPLSLSYFNIGKEKFEEMADNIAPVGGYMELNKADIVNIFNMAL
ncbi:iron-containing alcohol dehydrogenase [Halanaerobium sp. MA284_MarDTE_T2]|uniref:iron-containing alcohol dehydrogenase n=1 Tax=Halanaerobium sp. MA284_MarDTE_T2 TaxID=2183913 RepID=UPI000DF1D81D|nr:iron-containing alcohol dehydrogenase [Halanaerobium sp. MA284_MarDTE_T2]RCW48643.1 hypothetical protein DFR78_10825 [Halanaerobium sp. MA284_MarDTE_T2]